MDREASLALAWKWYGRTRAVWIRNYLVKRYIAEIERHARLLARRLPNSVEVDDLISMGAPGLLEAVERYKGARQVRFETFSGRRIRGAMLDGLRAVDPMTRTARSKAKRLSQTAGHLRQRLGREPSPEEIASDLGLSNEQYADHDRARQSAWERSLSGSRTEESKGVVAETIADQKAEDPARAALRNRVVELITQGLSRQERLIVVLYYYEGMTTAEIGQVLRLSESRISQMRTGIIRRLRGIVKPQDLEIG